MKRYNTDFIVSFFKQYLLIVGVLILNLLGDGPPF